jgi:hypothetical protein
MYRPACAQVGTCLLVVSFGTKGFQQKTAGEKISNRMKFFSVKRGVLLPPAGICDSTPSLVNGHPHFFRQRWASRLAPGPHGCVLGVHENAFFGLKDLVHNLVHT